MDEEKKDARDLLFEKIEAGEIEKSVALGGEGFPDPIPDKEYQEAIRDQIGDTSKLHSQIFLDLGSGMGGRLHSLLDKQGVSLTNIDLNAAHLDYLKRKGDSGVKADILNLPVSSNSVDGVISVNVINSGAISGKGQLEMLFKNVYRVLKPGGYFIQSHFGLDSLSNKEHFEKLISAGFKKIKLLYPERIQGGISYLAQKPPPDSLNMPDFVDLPQKREAIRLTEETKQNLIEQFGAEPPELEGSFNFYSEGDPYKYDITEYDSERGHLLFQADVPANIDKDTKDHQFLVEYLMQDPKTKSYARVWRMFSDSGLSIRQACLDFKTPGLKKIYEFTYDTSEYNPSDVRIYQQRDLSGGGSYVFALSFHFDTPSHLLLGKSKYSIDTIRRRNDLHPVEYYDILRASNENNAWFSDLDLGIFIYGKNVNSLEENTDSFNILVKENMDNWKFTFTNKDSGQKEKIILPRRLDLARIGKIVRDDWTTLPQYLPLLETKKSDENKSIF